MEEAQEPGRGDDDAPAPPAAEEAGISLHNFCGRLAEQVVHFHAMRLRDSLFLWVGDGPELSNLAVAMCNPRDSIPASTLLFGNASDNTSNSLAQRLGMRNYGLLWTSTPRIPGPAVRPGTHLFTFGISRLPHFLLRETEREDYSVGDM
ncbi:proteasome assembly chaperone 4-like isoform X1 [Thamnophis elegans]|uniref:proteasome assembly chaperone 4-like isoform X1 n=1 Tax=Thamnophis elegans TaxID=35005 RepID=UPI001377CF68|nr:proteasome assembly chaperone 4-like isoform X1 [Thamnophis elegans]